MEDKNEEKVKELSRMVASKCSVYPLPEESEIEDEVIRVKTIVKMSSQSPTDKKIARRVSKALDIRKKLKSDEWIQYRTS